LEAKRGEKSTKARGRMIAKDEREREKVAE
jgi:hypothetical protein